MSVRSFKVLSLRALGAMLLLVSCQGPARPRTEIVAHDLLEGLGSPVRVIVDLHGILHVYAANRPDAAFALGWFHARDRFLQMDVYRRAGHGRLAEILGPGAVDQDRFARILGTGRAARDAWRLLPPASGDRAIIQAYTNGVNSYLQRTPPSKLPEFYRSRRLVPEPWHPADCFAVHKRFTAELSHSFDDIMLQTVAERLGREAAEELFPAERDAHAPAVRHPIRADTLSGLKIGSAAGRQGTGERAPAGGPGGPDPIEGLAEAGETVSRRFGSTHRWLVGPGAYASNAWAVSGDLSADGFPILCSDPHMSLTRPGLFYTAHLESPGTGVIGVTIPGLPAVIFGHNGTIAWAATNARADVTDFYVETFDPENPDRYRFRGQWWDVERSEETIRVLGGEDIGFTVRRTHSHGPIISEGGRVLSMRWLGESPSADLVAFLRINAARDFQDFLDALRDYVAPAIVFVYADIRGNVALRPSGRVPIRSRFDGRYPVDGASGQYEWVGHVPFEEMPLALNPPEGYVVAANQRLVSPGSGYPYYLGWQFDSAFRARRIDEVLRTAHRVTRWDMVRLQLDSVDVCFRELVPRLIRAFEDARPADPLANLALRMIQGWDLSFRPGRPEPTIAWRWLEHFGQAVWEDDWLAAGLSTEGTWGLASDGWQPPVDVLVRLCEEDPESPWFDDRETPEREDLPAIMRASFLRAVASLGEEYGRGVASWRWGRVNRLVLDPLVAGDSDPLDAGPVPGNAHTVCPGGAGDAVRRGASFRMVVPLGGLATARGAAPGIQASLPPPVDADQLLRRQLRAFVSGDYLPLTYYNRFGDVPVGEVAQLVTLNPGLPPARREGEP